MARHVNKRFLALVIGVLIAATTAFVVLWQMVRITPEEHVDRGHRLWAQDQTGLAVVEFGKAVAKNPQDTALIMLYADMISQTRTSSPWEARDYLRAMRLAWERVLQLEAGNPQAFTNLMDLYMRLGRDVEIFETWRLMFDRCQEALLRRPDLIEAVRYRGIAQTKQIGQLDVGEEDRLQAKEDLHTALEHDPDDLAVQDDLIQWHLEEARIAESRYAAPELPAQLRNQARLLSNQMMEHHGDDPDARLYRCRLLLDLGDQQAAIPLVDELERQMLEQPTSVRATLRTANVLTRLDSNLDSWQRAVQVLRSGVKRWPDQASLYLSLGHVLRHLDLGQEAIEIFKQGREITAAVDPITAHLQAQTQMSCTFGYIDVRLDDLNKTTDTRAREEILAEADQLLDNLTSLSGEVWQIHFLQSKMAMARGQFETASLEADTALTKCQDPNTEMLMVSATLRKQLGEWGAATERYEQLIDLNPSLLRPYIELARLHIRLHELEQAEEVIEKLLGQAPNYIPAWRLKAAALVRRDRIDEAIEIYQGLDPDAYPELLPTFADYHARAGRPDEARRLFRQFFDEHPTNLIVLVELVGLSRDNDEALTYVDQARDKGADEKMLDLITSDITGSGLEDAMRRIIAEQGGSDLDQHLKLYEWFMGLSDLEQALGELRAAADIDSNHPMVITRQFDHAMANQDWEEANLLADRAADLNLDQAQGNLYYGRLYYAQGDFNHAVSCLQQMLRQRGVYSDGWRLLGDVQLAMGELSEATASYLTAVQQHRNNVDALSGLARVHHQQRDFTSALEQLRKAKDYAPANRTLRGEYIRYEREYGDPLLARKFCQKLATSEPADTDNRRTLAILLAQQSQPKQAHATIHAIIEEEGNIRENLQTKAVVLAEGGDLRGGRDLLKKYVMGLGELATITDWLMLGRFLFDYEETDAARSVYRRAMEIEDPEHRPVTRELADRLFQADQLDQANLLYGELWELNPDDPRFGMRFVESLGNNENGLANARNVLDKVVVDNSLDDPVILILQGMLAQSEAEPQRALDAFSKSITLSPHWATAYHQRAQLLADDPSQRDQVLSDLRKALELNRDLHVARRLLANLHIQAGEKDQAIREFASLVSRSPRDESSRLILANLYFEEKNRLALQTLLDESKKLFPENAMWPNWSANLAILLKEVDAAINHLRDALALKADPATVSRLAALLIKTQKPEAALNLLREHDQWTSTSSEQLSLRALALSQLGQVEHALSAFGLAVQVSKQPGDVLNTTRLMIRALGREQTMKQLGTLASGQHGVWVELATAQLIYESRDFARLLAILKNLEIRIAHESVERDLYDRLLVIGQHRTGQVDAAKATYERILARNAEDVEALNNLAYLLVNDLNDPMLAIELAQKADRLRPSNPNVLDTLGWAQFKANHMTSARNNLERSVSLREGASNCLHLAQVLIKQLNYQRAQTLATKALKLAEQRNQIALTEQARSLLQELERLQPLTE